MFDTSDRLLRVNMSFAKATLWLVELIGCEAYSYEGLFTLRLLASRDDCPTHTWIGRSISFSVHPNDQDARYFSGYIVNVTAEPVKEKHRPYRFYTIEVSSWLHLLAYTQNCRSFLNQSTLDIVLDIWQQLPIATYDIFNLTDLPALSQKNAYYHVQYNESNLAFTSRLLADASIFYWIEYTDNKQKVRLSNSTQVYCLQLPAFSWPDEKPHSDLYQLLDARISWQQHRQPHCQLSLRSRVLGVSLGQRIKINNTPHELTGEQSFFPYKITHFAKDYGGLPDSQLVADKPLVQHAETIFYENEIAAIPWQATPYYPECPYQKPKMAGVFSGFVVGATGQAIYTDKLGRVKVWFPWDTHNPQKDPMLCPWVRVRHHQAGNQWGQQFIPHVGDEVLVMYVDDNAEQPIVIGSAYNDCHQPPFNVKQHPASTGIKTQRGHALYADDQAGRERLVLYSMKDLMQVVGGDHTRTIYGYDYVDVYGDAVEAVLQGEYSIHANKRIRLQSGASVIDIDEKTIHINAPQIQFITSGNQKPQALSVVGSHHTCPKKHKDGSSHLGGPILQGSPNVTVGAKAAARVGDRVQCQGAIDTLTQGHPNLFINNQLAVCVNHQTEHGGQVVEGVVQTTAS